MQFSRTQEKNEAVSFQKFTDLTQQNNDRGLLRGSLVTVVTRAQRKLTLKQRINFQYCIKVTCRNKISFSWFPFLITPFKRHKN